MRAGAGVARASILVTTQRQIGQGLSCLIPSPGAPKSVPQRISYAYLGSGKFGVVNAQSEIDAKADI